MTASILSADFAGSDCGTAGCGTKTMPDDGIQEDP